MPTAYLIDGYNLLHAVGILNGPVGPHGLEQARDRLVTLLAEAFANDAARLTVVFDSSRAPPGAPRELHQHGIRILFAARGQEADDLIEDLLALDTDPRHLVIVSSDHRLLDAARRRHAKPLDCQAFLDLLEQRQHDARPNPRPAAEKDVKETDSEKRDWLAEFKDVQELLDREDRRERDSLN